MTKYSINKIFALSMLLLLACQNDILDKTPLDKYSDALLWSDINLADKYLLDTYNTTLTGETLNTYVSLAAVTDESQDTHGFGTTNYLQGNLTADNAAPFTGFPISAITWDALFKNIQKLNVFLANIDVVPDAYNETQKPDIQAKAEIMKGEGIFLRAFCYVQLARNYGGVPIIKEPFKVGADFLSLKRATFKETVDFITGECDAAAAVLSGRDEMEMGRATKGAALALKSRMLLFAASDLTSDGTAASEYVGYLNPDRNALWTAAKNAAKQVMDLGAYDLADFGAPDQRSVAQKFFEFFKAKDLSNIEVIWGKMFLKDVGDRNSINLINGTNGFVMYGCNGPTQDLVDAFQMEDGSSFSGHFEVDADRYYRNVSGTYTYENPYYHREPRFYATILYDSAVWQKRYPDLAERDPLGIYDRRTRITVTNGTQLSKIYGIDTRQGPVDPDDGTYTGYTFKKYLDDAVYGTESENNDNAWIEFRYAEILMNYAEACLELNDPAEAAIYINKIRNRAGLPDFTGDITQALRYERRVEFVYEDVRWYDIRRWKILDETIKPVLGVDIIETNTNGTVTTTWQQIDVEDRGPAVDKMYWLPIGSEERNRAPQLEQNPGY
jgi:hypothetical protein